MLSKMAFHFFRKVKPNKDAAVPTLVTERLRLRAPQDSDYPSILKLGSDPEVMRYITYGKTQSPEEARKDLSRRISLSRGRHGYWIAEDKNTGNFIGWMALKPLENRPEFEIGYRFLQAHWGKGLATEAGQRLLQYAFEELRLDQIIAVAMPENQASRRVMEKLGLTHIGFDTFYGVHCVVYRILAIEFS